MLWGSCECFIYLSQWPIIVDVLPPPPIKRASTAIARTSPLTAPFCSVVFVSTYRFIILSTYQTTDASYTYAPIAVWSLIEIAAGLISASLPLLGPIANLGLQHVGIQNGLGSFLASRSRPTRNKYSYHKKSSGAYSYGGSSSSGGHSRFLRSNDMMTLRGDLDDGVYGVVAEAAGGVGSGGGQMHALAEFQTRHTTPPTPTDIGTGGIWDGSTEIGTTANAPEKPQGRVITKKLKGPGFSPRLSARADRAQFERLPDMPPVPPLGGIEVRQEFGVVALPRKFTGPEP